MNSVEEMDVVFRGGEPLSCICDTAWRECSMGAGGHGEGSLRWERISDVQDAEHRATHGAPEHQRFGAAPQVSMTLDD